MLEVIWFYRYLVKKFTGNRKLRGWGPIYGAGSLFAWQKQATLNVTDYYCFGKTVLAMQQFVSLIFHSRMWVLLGQHHFLFAVFPMKPLFAEADCSYSKNLESIFAKLKLIDFPLFYLPVLELLCSVISPAKIRCWKTIQFIAGEVIGDDYISLVLFCAFRHSFNGLSP